jgi:hypothetical protein
MVTCTFCRIKGFKLIISKCVLKKWKKVREPPSMIKRSEGQNTRVGNAETKSNGCKGQGEQETLIETVRSLKIEVWSYKVDNERMMREKSQINARVLQILNQLQRQTNNGSKQEEEGRYHEIRDDRGRDGYSRSASRAHRHHSPPYSTRNFYASEYSISSP